MTRIGTMLVVAAALAIGALLVDVDSAHAQLGAASAAIGSGGDAIGQGAQDEAASETPRASAPRLVGQCVTNRTAFRAETNTVNNSLGAFTVMPNTHFPVTHAAGCLIVDFVAEVVGFVDTGMEIRAWIGGIGAATPPSAQLGPPVTSSVRETRSMRFVFANVPAGTHTVRIDWRSLGNLVSVINRTLTVQYR